jgi:pseudouridine-5'-phosphate glycosidase
VTVIKLAHDVRVALDNGGPVVALESTIISHGLPHPDNLEAAREFESLVRAHGATPATIAVVDGVARVGLSDDQLDLIASNPEVEKLSVRDLPIVMAKSGHGATTVAATSYLAARAGIRVFATGGLGGVHHGAQESFDESADLTTLAHTPVAVVSAGVKSVLDIQATLERLETLGVPVLGFGTDVFPRFWLPRSDFSVDHRVDSAQDVAAVIERADQLGVTSGMVVANPIPDDQAWHPEDHDRFVAEAFTAAETAGIRGKEVTPFLLDFIQRASGGDSLRVNLDVVRNNIRVASAIAIELSRRSDQ